MTLEGRFWSKVGMGPNGCWVWLGCLSRGYGQFWREGRMRQAHLVALDRVGALDGLEVDHLCRNKRCVNPDHLEVVTHSINIRRRELGNIVNNGKRNNANLAKTHCSRGHAYDEANTYVRPSGSRECRSCIEMRRASRGGV